MDFSQLDKTIHEKGRLAIMSILVTRKSWPFQDLKAELNMSDGNLITHLRALHLVGYVSLTKEMLDRPQTRYAVTEKGSREFMRYIDLLEEIVKQARR